MRRCSVLQRGILGITRVLRIRRAHAGVRQTWAAMERQVLLEEAMTLSAPVRGAQNSAESHMSAQTAAYLRDLTGCDADVSPGAAIQGVLPSAATSDTPPTSEVDSQVVTADAGSATPVASLSQFFAECKRHRIAIGSAHEQETRNKMRAALRDFWAAHVGSAVRCCAQRGRDVGFLASQGLADSALHLPVAALGVALDALVAELAVSSALDVCTTLHYLARELAYVERGESRRSAALARLRRTLTDVAVERFVFFFIEHAPQHLTVGSAPPNRDVPPSDDAEQRSKTLGASVATAEDALHALETLSYLRVDDASPATLRVASESARRAAATHMRPRTTQSRMRPGVSSEVAGATLSQEYLVARVFDLVIVHRGQLRFTSLVQAFALLRIFLPQLWPPRGHDERGRSIGSDPEMTYRHEADTRRAARERLSRLTWALARELRRRDAQLVNPYHFIKITTTLARLPAFVLVPVATNDADKTHLFSLTVPQVKAGKAAMPLAVNAASTRHFLPAATFWHYIVSKACIFVPSLPPSQRRIVCYTLDVAIRQKRGSYLDRGSNAIVSAIPASHDTQHACRATRTPLGDSVEDILLPLKQAMRSYDEDFDRSVMLGARRRERR